MTSAFDWAVKSNYLPIYHSQRGARSLLTWGSLKGLPLGGDLYVNVLVFGVYIVPVVLTALQITVQPAANWLYGKLLLSPQPLYTTVEKEKPFLFI